ncbi:MAG TPA: amidohydrolase family protein [Longimicrobiales bacterium]|nr:amidohydrolase family protein [Longimicrobiales bacterium]
MLVEGERIVTVGPTDQVVVPNNTEVVDGAGHYLIPGLWDMHVHVADAHTPVVDMPLMVAHGVTGVREMGTDCQPGEAGICLDSVRTWQRRIEARELLGPRLLALSSWAVAGPPPPDRPLPDSVPTFFRAATPDDARLLARHFAAQGVDFIKVYDRVPRELFFALMDEARRLGLPVAGHKPREVSAIELSNAGQASVEHARVFLFDCFPSADSLRRSGAGLIVMQRRAVDEHDPAMCEEVFRTFAENGTAYVPTHLTRRMDAFADDSTFRNDARSKYIPEGLWVEWNEDADRMVAVDPSPEGRRAMMDFYLKGLEITGTAHRAGVRVMLGTDSGDSYVFPGFAVHDELKELVRAGLTPAEALRAATLTGAEFLGRTADFGTVAVGKRADLVLLSANPLDDIRNTQRIEAVVLDGRYLDREALDALLVETEKAAKTAQN